MQSRVSLYGASTRADDSPVDQALALLLADETEAALRWSAAAIERDPTTPAGLIVTSRLLRQMGRVVASEQALRLALRHAMRARDLPLAIVAATELRSLGFDADAERAELAAAFAERPVDAEGRDGAGASGDTFRPLSPFLTGHDLATSVAKIVRAASAADASAPAEPSAWKGCLPPFFRGLSREELSPLLATFETVTVAAGQRLVEQGEVSTGAFVVAHGEVEVSRRLAPSHGGSAIAVARLTSGALFGELALLGPIPEATCVVAARPSIALVLRREAIERLAAAHEALAETIFARCRRQAVTNLACMQPLVATLPPEDRTALVESLHVCRLEPGAKLLVEGEEAPGIYLVTSGEVTVSATDGADRIVLARLGPGDTIGEVETVLVRHATVDAVATQCTATLFLARATCGALTRTNAALLQQLYARAVDELAFRSRLLAASSVVVPDACVVEDAPRGVAPRAAEVPAASHQAADAPGDESIPAEAVAADGREPRKPEPPVAPPSSIPPTATSVPPPPPATKGARPASSGARPSRRAALGVMAIAALTGAILSQSWRSAAPRAATAGTSEPAPLAVESAPPSSAPPQAMTDEADAASELAAPAPAPRATASVVVDAGAARRARALRPVAATPAAEASSSQAPAAASAGARPHVRRARMRPCVIFAVTAALATAASSASAEPAAPSAAAHADALFREAEALRAQDKYAEACQKFAESRALAPGVGVALHLADCYEHVGRTASAWLTFRAAEQHAIERHDPRASVARACAEALEAKLSFVAVDVPTTAGDAAEIKIDGARIPRVKWSSGVPLNPGEHLVTLDTPGAPPRHAKARLVDPGMVTVRFPEADPPPAPAAPPPAATASSAAPAPAATPPSTHPPAAPAAPSVAFSTFSTPTASRTSAPSREWVIAGLLGTSAVCVGVGAAFLVARNDSMSNGTATSPPHEDRGAARASAVAFALGGATVVSAVVLYLTAPSADGSAISVSPTAVAGGGGALLRATF